MEEYEAHDVSPESSSPTPASPETAPPPAEAPAAAPATPPAAAPIAAGWTLGTFLVGVWHVFELLSRLFLIVVALGLGVMLIVFPLFLIGLASAGEGPVVAVADSTALVVKPTGIIVEQLTGDPMDRAMQKLMGEEVPESLLKDLVDAIRAGKDDDRVKVLYLDLNSLLGAGLTKLQALRTAIDDFKESGKPVIAAADVYDNSRYHLAAGADEIYLHEMGGVLLEGYGRYSTYYKAGLDRFGIDWNVFHVGTYKSAIEPFTLEGMSEGVKDVNLEWLGDLWGSYLDDVAAGRDMTPAAVTSSIDQFNVHLAQSGGDLAAMAKGLGLVDHVGQRDLVRQRLIELTGEDEKTHSFHGVGYRDYLRVAGGPPATQSDAKVAVLVAKGTILNGQQPLGTIGGDSAATLIRRARHDDDTKALVLRVDSGGGSAFASEVIRRELELLREAGKPVVVSMGSYAASGGYWIATSSDEIWASPTTVTGSIGIFGFFPTFQNPLKEYLGVQVDGVGTAWLSEVRPDLEMPEAFGVAMQAIIEKGYRDFLDRVGGARDMTREEVNLIAQGRVWSGLQAKEIGLVDQLGDLDDAIASAAVHAGLGEDYGVEYLEKELDFGDQLLIDLLEEASVWQPLMARGARRQGLDSVLQRIFSEQVETFSRFDDPMGMYAHCLCEVN